MRDNRRRGKVIDEHNELPSASFKWIKNSDPNIMAYLVESVSQNFTPICVRNPGEEISDGSISLKEYVPLRNGYGFGNDVSMSVLFYRSSNGPKGNVFLLQLLPVLPSQRVV